MENVASPTPSATSALARTGILKASVAATTRPFIFEKSVFFVKLLLLGDKFIQSKPAGGPPFPLNAAMDETHFLRRR